MQNKVLLLEPNSRMLETLATALVDGSEVRYAGTVTGAVETLQSWEPDLVISEYRLGDGTGLDVIDKLRRAGVKAPPIMMIASRADTVDRRLSGNLQIDEVVQKPFFVSELRERIKRALSRAGLRRAGENPGMGNFRGRLADLSIVDLLQALDLSCKTCTVTVTETVAAAAAGSGSAGEVKRTGQLILIDGQVRDATCGDVRGKEAAFKMLGWKDGEFSIDFSPRQVEASITGSTQGLLLDGLRILDEAKMKAK